MLKAATLTALGNMPTAEAHDAARAIIKHLDGIEFGIEYLPLPTGGEVAYVNTGDTYSATLLHVDGEWIYSCWGDVYEAAEKAHTEDDNTRCGYCGEWSEGEDPCHNDDGSAFEEPEELEDFFDEAEDTWIVRPVNGFDDA